MYSLATTRSAVRHSRGFTLLELMVTLGIAAILATVAVPGMLTSIRNTQKAACLNDAVGVLNLARTEAITLQETVSACASSDQATCNTNNWEEGWLVFVDDGTGAGATADDRNINGTERLIRVGQPSCSDGTIRAENLLDAGGIDFDLNGMTSDRGTLIVCNDNGAKDASAVVLNISGQPRLATDDDADGVVNDDEDDEVTCP